MKRLDTPHDETPMTDAIDSGIGGEMIGTYSAMLNHAKQLERENFSLSAGMCLHGLKGDDHGNQYCPRIRQLEGALKKMASAFRKAINMAAAGAPKSSIGRMAPDDEKALAEFETLLRELGVK